MGFKLPFKTEPNQYETVVVGNPEIGELELKKMHGLLVGEQVFVDEYMRNFPDPEVELIKVTEIIAAHSGTSVSEVYQAASESSNFIFELIQRYGSSFAQDLLKVNAAYAKNSAEKEKAYVTAIIQNRLLSGWTVEDTINPLELHPKLKKEIFKFAISEERGWQPVEKVELQSVPITDEELGNESETEKLLTGEKSSGESEDTGQQNADSTIATLEVSQSG
jgi:hypothetical protein